MRGSAAFASGLFLPAELELEQFGEGRVGNVAFLLRCGVEPQRRTIGIASRRPRPPTVVARRPVVARTIALRPISLRPVSLRRSVPAVGLRTARSAITTG